MTSGWRKSHETKFFGMAIRVITAQSKLPAMAGTLEAILADAIEGPLPEERPSQPSDETENWALAPNCFADPADPAEPAAAPPVRDCSPVTGNGSSGVASPSREQVAIPNNATTSADLSDGVRAARRAFFGPAQQPAAEVDDEPVTELKIRPQQPGIRVERPLTRRERRRLAKMGA